MSRRYRKRYELGCVVAGVTRDDLQVIRHRGFSPIDLEDQHFNRESDLRASLILAWDGLADFGDELRVHRPARQVA